MAKVPDLSAVGFASSQNQPNANGGVLTLSYPDVVREAWASAYFLLSSTMQRAAAEAATMDISPVPQPA